MWVWWTGLRLDDQPASRRIDLHDSSFKSGFEAGRIDSDDLPEHTWRKQVTLIWLGLGISLLGLALLSIFGLSGSGYSAVSVWGYRVGLLLMFAGLSLCVAVT